MDTSRVDLIIQFSVLAAGQEDDYLNRWLGPIHLIKYVYLADLAYASGHNGQSYTGIPWKFYKFGPWSQEVNAQIDQALSAISAERKSFPSKYEEEKDWKRWSKFDRQLFEEIGSQLPLSISLEVKRAVHEYGQDTPSLLNYVYLTEPMLNAAPNELLDFSIFASAKGEISEDEENKPLVLSNKQKRELKRAIKDFQEKRKEVKARRKSKLANPVKPADYDDSYYEGVQWLDSLAGPDLEVLKHGKFEVTFSPSIWKSPVRKGEDVS